MEFAPQVVHACGGRGVGAIVVRDVEVGSVDIHGGRFEMRFKWLRRDEREQWGRRLFLGWFTIEFLAWAWNDWHFYFRFGPEHGRVVMFELTWGPTLEEAKHL